MATTRKKAEPTAQPEPEVVEQSPEDPVNAVIVIKVVEDGNIRTEITTAGDIQLTEVQTLLELGVSGWRKQIGLSGQ